MLASKTLIATLKEKPADAELISHRLMLRAGLIRKVSSGIYVWLPLGLRVLRKVEQIVREEMNRVGALEVMMPAVQPAELWVESQRWDKYGKELLRIRDRHEREFCFGPTHEEVITDVARRELRSYKQLPINFYQIQTKFRDEIRPRFGVMRAREFIMKDAYSFHMDKDSLQTTYDAMYQAYSQIFTRLGLKFRAVMADTGAIGGNFSHEFQVLAESGEDVIAFSDGSDYAANVERAEALAPQNNTHVTPQAMEKFATPNVRTIQDLTEHHQLAADRGVKTLIVKGAEQPYVALILRGDHDLNSVKAEKLAAVAAPLEFADEVAVRQAVGASVGSLGPVNMKLPMIVDRDAAVLVNFACGANEDGFHLKNVNWQRDVDLPEVADIRNVVVGDASPDGKGQLQFARGIEVGHIFQLGDRYSRCMNMTVLNEQGQAINPLMGCYGIGVSRIVAAAIEQHHDEQGIIWPIAMAPYQVAIVPLSMHKSYRVREMAEKIYQQLLQQGYEVLMDDRKERPGVVFATMDLLGIPHRLVISERGLDQGTVEYKRRDQADSEHWPLDGLLEKLAADCSII